jgi:hypothetical protein
MLRIDEAREEFTTLSEAAAARGDEEAAVLRHRQARAAASLAN